MRPAGWFARADISGGLRPPLAPALHITFCFRVLSTAPKGSRLLSRLPLAERTREGLVFFNARGRIFPENVGFGPIPTLPWSFSDIFATADGAAPCSPSRTAAGVPLRGDPPAVRLQQRGASPQPNPASPALLFTFLQPAFNPESSTRISTNSS